MFIRNSWYVAAWSKEVSRASFLSRTFLNEPVVLYRKYDGTAVALHDMCPHRFAPLSCGRLMGESIECGYHGMTFDSTGKCVINPTQPDEAIPAGARVKSYPIIERNSMVWIWMGDPKKADENLLPDYYQYNPNDPNYGIDGTYIKVKCNYQLLNDNLLDLSHAAYIHRGQLGDEKTLGKVEMKTEYTERSVLEKRLIPDSPAVPSFKAAFNDYEGNVDLWLDMYWNAVSTLILDVGVTPTGHPREEGVPTFALHCLTPETATTTNYFYGISHSYKPQDISVTSFWMQVFDSAFNDDKNMLEAVQTRMGDEWDILKMRPVTNKADRAAVIARRIVKRMLDEESSEALKASA